MKRLLRAAATGAGPAAPALAQPATTYQPGTGQYGAPSVQASNVMPEATAPQTTAVPGRRQLGCGGPTGLTSPT